MLRKYLRVSTGAILLGITIAFAFLTLQHIGDAFFMTVLYLNYRASAIHALFALALGLIAFLLGTIRKEYFDWLNKTRNNNV
jgi:hypothetical protein